jgi:hypothetical protein
MPLPFVRRSRTIDRCSARARIRVPDAGLYIRSSVASLAYNGLLEWPHRFGFGVPTLRRFAAEHRFAPQRALGWIELTFRKERMS